MGLDNGIILKRKDGGKIEYPSFVFDYWKDIETEDNKIELAYWRKCWGVRDEIISLFGGENEYGDYPLNEYQVLEIIKILNKFLDKDYYEMYADSIWSYDEHIKSAVKNLINLSWLSWYMEQEKGNIEVYFYDSY